MVVLVSWRLIRQVLIMVMEARGPQARVLLPLVPKPSGARLYSESPNRPLYRTTTFRRDDNGVRGEVQALSVRGIFYTAVTLAPRTEAATVRRADVRS